ncbi:hybrid sensor histidine kinase/response regulator transcription factor [Carboxylicivirga marina]|uniref:histidine kinase n=1 Tax=Carboxylicivirga marina TaxID=2800988 RepID=A0ABS1HEW8_9BACT|nr:ATP-binding protein [Carboxylicivirga marina]MBK3516212.1 response regulator [Carboxylicivirga marina]
MRVVVGKCFTMLFFALFLLGQTADAYEIKHLGIEDGLSNGYVNDFETDSLGYMWIATSNGLNRHSGYEIRNYSFSQTTNKWGNRVIELIKYQGELFVINQGGSIYQYRYEYDDFVILGEAYEHEFMSACLVDNYMIIGMLNGLLVFDMATKRFSEVLYPELSYNRHLKAKDGQVYLATSKGIHTFRFLNGKLTDRDVQLEQMDIIHFDVDAEKRLWVGTENKGLIIIDDKDNLYPLELFKSSSTYNTVRSIAFNEQGEAVVAVDRLGLFVIDKSMSVKYQFRHNPDNINSIRQNSVHDIYIDDANTYWLASGETGIDILYNSNKPFRNIAHVLNKKNSLHNNSVRSIFEDKNGHIWFGTEDGLSRVKKDEHWQVFNQANDLSGIPVLSLSDYQGHLLLGTYGEGIIELNLANGLPVSQQMLDKPPHKLVFTTFANGDELWIGGTDGPVMCYVAGKLNQTYPVGSAKCFVKGGDEIIYVGGMNGVFELNKRNGSHRKLTYSTETANNVLTGVNGLYYDGLHNLWIGNDKGLFVYDLDNNYVEQHSSVSNKQLGIVYSLLDDVDNNLWLAASTGLWKLDIDKKHFRHYDSKDGVDANEFGFGASAKLKNGELAFGGPDGAVVFHPDSVSEYNNMGRLRVSEFLINGLLPDSSTILKDINYIDEVELTYNQNSLAFTFEVVELHGPRKSNFEWQLVGYDEQALLSSDQRKVRYSKLSPGDYQLLVKAISPDGKYLNSEYRLDITILQPVWLRWWAFVLYAFLAFGLLLLLIVTTRAKQQQRFSDEKIRFFVNVAHDIRTPISLIQLLVEQLPKNGKSKDAVGLIMRNAGNLNEYVSQLLEFQKAERQKLKLKVQEVDLQKLLKSISNDFQPLLEKKSMDLEVSSHDVNLWVDKVKMSRVFNNLISNAIKYGEEGGHVKIETKLLDGKLRIDFIDNGLGVPEKQQKQIFSRFSRGENVRLSGISGTGIGLMLAKRIVELHHGKIYLESKENIGSTFSVELLLGSSHYKGDEIIIEESHDDSTSVSDIIGENKLVLLVEDNDDLRATIKAELEKSYRVIEAPNGKEGLVLAVEKNPDLIITDVMMPQMNGKELCQVIKSNFKTSHIPVVMITALIGVDDKVEGLEVGADAYVEKPFSIDVLKATINNLLRTRQALGQVTNIEEEKKTTAVSPDEEFLSNAVQLIKKNMTDRDFTIDVLCERLGLSRSNLFRKLKGLTGMTPSDLMIKIKLNHAVELFKSGKNMRIADIAYESGFHDPKYFSTVFKKFHGKTPKEFMESQG